MASAVNARQFKGEEMIFTAPKTKSSASGYKKAKSTTEHHKVASAGKRTKAKSSDAPARKSASRSRKH